MTPHPPTFGRWLKQLRAARDMTQERLAEEVGCAAQTVRMVESARRRPSREMTARMADVLGVAGAQRDTFFQLARTPLGAEELAEARPPDDVPASAGRARPLPQAANPLIGRAAELAVLTRAFTVEGRRLVTLLGPGGIGKTRLALQAAAELGPHFADGAAWVELAPLTAADQAPGAIARALGVSLQAGGDATAQLGETVRGQALLLVLDNAEHLPDVGALVALLLAGAPGLRVLVTSRERLRLPGEATIVVPGLELPAGAGGTELASAARLFLERARQVDHGFTLDSERRSAVARICRLLEGTPLAIELAAAWVSALSPSEIADEVAASLDFLGEHRAAPGARHGSMRAVFEQSWRLLSPGERRVLAGLTVFSGGCSREAAARVAGASLPTLAGLIDKSLVRAFRPPNVATRYDLHALVRQYAAEQLAAELDAVADVRKQHLAFFADLAAASLPGLWGEAQAATLDVLARDADNLRLAWAEALDAHDLDALRLVGGCLYFLADLRGELPAFAALAEPVIAELRGLGAAAGPMARHTLGQVLTWRGAALGRIGELETARHNLDEATALLADNEALLAAANSLGFLGAVCYQLGRYAQARRALERNQSLCRHHGTAFLLTISSVYLGRVALAEGDLGAAEAALATARAESARSGSQSGLLIVEGLAASVALERGDGETADGTARLILRLAVQHRDPWGASLALLQLGRGALARGDLEEARYLLSESGEGFAEIGERWWQAVALLERGDAEQQAGAGAAARRSLAEVGRLALVAGMAPLGLAALAGFAVLAATTGDARSATVCAAAAVAHSATWAATRLRAARLLDALESDAERELAPASGREPWDVTLRSVIAGV